ncbi:hypothetical protein H5P28_18900 [Ruficoccus amylovorans]|uniref:Uncharacterized protein n=1 Tax=Ruficoccus amylovorans TaxID=1804625 RepID=A0A842HMM9_9BACT|nr:hypothetical protein [Ruficoccus amylovorans]MBC2596341.1 hypothetical protein [Ruficoccus amylovorans]
MKKPVYPLIAALIPALAILAGGITFSTAQLKDFVDKLSDMGNVSEFPGEFTFHCATAEPQVVWLYQSVLYQGRQYTTDRLPEGITLHIESLDGGEAVEIRNPGGSTTKHNGNMAAVVVAKFTPPHPGDYVLRVNGDSKKFILAVGPDDFAETFMKIATGLFGLFGGIAGAVIAFVAVFFPLRARNRKQAGPPPIPEA